MSFKKIAGNSGEALVSSVLQNHGYQIIRRNYFVSGKGEIDVIASKNKTLVFVEVRTRSNKSYGLPEESVTRGKLWKLKKTAYHFLAFNSQLQEYTCVYLFAAVLVKDDKSYLKFWRL